MAENSNPSFRKPFFIHSFHKSCDQIIKYYSSIHRARTYYKDRKKDELGGKRYHMKLSRPDDKVKKRGFWNFNSPKLSVEEIKELLADKDLLQEYVEAVSIFEDDKLDYLKTDKKYLFSNEIFIDFINQLEQDWLFHRFYYKVFRDVDTRQTVLFIDLAAYCSTRHIRFLMRHMFDYLEGNYVISLRPKPGREKEGKVYIPHLQFPDESVELTYSSAESLKVEDMVADYIIKENIRSVDTLMEKFKEISELKVDVAKDEREPIFIKTSEYINRDELLKAYEKWLKKFGNKISNFKDRDSIIQSIDFDDLDVVNNDKIFKWDKLRKVDRINYETDFHEFFKRRHIANKWLIRELFNDFLENSINKYRFQAETDQSKGASIESRSEYENVFRKYKYMTALEQDLACLLIEDGEISFVLFLMGVLENDTLFENEENLIDKLIYWGLLELENGQYSYTERARRMAKWCMKLSNLSYSCDTCKIDYSNECYENHYHNLRKDKGFFGWMGNIPHREEVSQIFGRIIFSKKPIVSKNKIVETFKSIFENYYSFRDDDIKERIEEKVKNSRFNKPLNQFLRAYESINRAVIAFPISTIPTDIEKKTRTFSIFIGTFTMDDRMDSTDPEEFKAYVHELSEKISLMKAFFTLVGKPASESLNEAIIRNQVQERIESTIGRFVHKVKNEAVNVINEMDNISTIVEEDEDEYCDIAIEMQELNEITTRLSGSIQILNIAANGFDPKYFEKQDYCILNVISRAYCTAIKQFYSGGNVDELDKLMVNNENIYRLPVLDFKLSVNMNNDNYSVEKKIIKIPRVAKGRYQYPEHGYKIFKEEFDEVDLIKDTSRIFKDRLPQKVILHSPVYEMFINALSYMSKKEEDFHIVLHVEKNNDLIKITIRNKLKEGFVIDEKELQRIEDSAGLGANRLFFRNIGGHFEFEYDTFSMEAVAKTIINLTELNKY